MDTNKNLTKRILAILLSAFIFITYMPGLAYAAQDTPSGDDPVAEAVQGESADLSEGVDETVTGGEAAEPEEDLPQAAEPADETEQIEEQGEPDRKEDAEETETRNAAVTSIDYILSDGSNALTINEYEIVDNEYNYYPNYGDKLVVTTSDGSKTYTFKEDYEVFISEDEDVITLNDVTFEQIRHDSNDDEITWAAGGGPYYIEVIYTYDDGTTTTTAKTNIEVCVQASDVSGITFAPKATSITLYNGVDGWTENGNFYFNVRDVYDYLYGFGNDELTIQYNDGTSDSVSLDEVRNWEYVTKASNNKYVPLFEAQGEDPWTVGTSYDVFLMAMGSIDTDHPITVTIKDSPVKSFSFEQSTKYLYVFNGGGEEQDIEYDASKDEYYLGDGSYNGYAGAEGDVLTFEYKDGTKKVFKYGRIENDPDYPHGWDGFVTEDGNGNKSRLEREITFDTTGQKWTANGDGKGHYYNNTVELNYMGALSKETLKSYVGYQVWFYDEYDENEGEYITHANSCTPIGMSFKESGVDIFEPERDGYTLAGWYEMDQNGKLYDEPYNFDEPVTKETFLYAKWEEHIHELVKVDAKDASCTEDGNTEYWFCSGCEKYFSDAEGEHEISTVTIPATGHAWGKWQKDNAEQHKRICENDPNHVETAVHTWDDGEVTTPATEDAEGVKTYTCTVCGETKTESIPKLDHVHNMTEHARVEAACETEGNSAYWSCDKCGKYYSDAEGDNEIANNSWVIEALGHLEALPPVTENVVDATCIEEGSYDEVVYCTRCGEELSRETKTLEKIPHTAGEAVRENVVDPTYTKEGSYDEVVYCTVCGQEIHRESRTIEALEVEETGADVSFADNISEEDKEAVSNVTASVQDKNLVEVAKAAADEVEVTAADGLGALQSEGLAGDASAEDVSIVIQTYLDMEIQTVNRVEGSDEIKSVTIEITPKVSVIAALDETNINIGTNAVVVEEKPITVNKATKVEIRLPEAFANSNVVYVLHNGEEYEASPKDGESAMFVFSTNGFSPFVFSKEHTHNLTTHAGKAPACETAGNSAYWSCSICGKYFSDANAENEIEEGGWVIEATGHTLGKVAATAKNIEYYKCSKCGKCFSDAAGTKEISESSTVINATAKVRAATLPLKKKQKVNAAANLVLPAGVSVKSVTSSNTKILTVSGTTLKGKKKGKSVVTCTLTNGTTAKYTVKVQNGKVKANITGVPKSLTLHVGETYQIKADKGYVTCTYKLKYKSSKKKVAIVSNKGLVTAKMKGMAKITVKCGSKKKTVKVNVIP